MKAFGLNSPKENRKIRKAKEEGSGMNFLHEWNDFMVC